MYRVFIADDESWILERLVTTIDWQSIGAEVVGRSMNGREAYEKISGQEIDVLITDIRMPEIDGLELIEEVRKQQRSIKCIIISGYSDFSYARKAIQEGVSDYILKPVGDSELLEKVKQCCRELDKERSLVTKARENQSFDRKSRVLLREENLRKLICGTATGFDEVSSEDIARSGIDDSLGNYVCLGIVFDNFVEDEDVSLSQFVVENILIDLCENFGTSYCVKIDSELLMCVIGTKETENTRTKIGEIAESLRKLVNRVLGVSISVGVGKVCDSIYKLNDSAESAKKALMNRFFIGGNSVIDYEAKTILPTKDKLKYEDFTHIVNFIKVGDEEKATSGCHYYIQRLKFSNSDIQPINLKIIFQKFVFAVAESCFSSDNASRILYNSDYFVLLHSIRDLETMEEAMVSTIHFLCGEVLMPRQDSRKQAIETAISYIKENYGDKITLKEVSGLVYLNTSYFCKIFKEEMGESFVNYLIRYRMKKAAEYLEDFSLKIYEVAEMVGYNDMQYFTKLYKKVHGISPKDYRTKLVKKDNGKA